MKTLKNIVVAFLLLISFDAIYNRANAQTNVDVSFNVFYESLKPHGVWFNYGEFGMCWRPDGISRSWEPYRNGHWIWTDYGWTWDSDYSWGWAPYHYGRWTFDDYYGWIWVPDYEWSPAWVQWRYDQDYIGWAPLPPKARFTVSIGIDFDDYGVGYRHWNYIYGRNMTDIRYRFLPRNRVFRIHSHTTNITNITIVNNHIYNHGPRINDIERMSGTKIRQYNIIQDREPNRDKNFNRIENNNLHVYHPEINRTNGSTRGNTGTPNEINRNNPVNNNNNVQKVDRNADRTKVNDNRNESIKEPNVDRGNRNDSQNKNEIRNEKKIERKTREVNRREAEPKRSKEPEKKESRERNSESKERSRTR
jgi:hypothetical protein